MPAPVLVAGLLLMTAALCLLACDRLALGALPARAGVGEDLLRAIERARRRKRHGGLLLSPHDDAERDGGVLSGESLLAGNVGTAEWFAGDWKL